MSLILKHGSLFSGIGGFDLAAQWMGWENKFHCEWNEFGQQVLKYYWPNAISYADITKTDFSIWRGLIDILTGGFPCQPYSTAGNRKGSEDERHLWPEKLRAIREIEPTWVVGENVRGLINWNGGLVFDEVQADLEAQGYKVQSFLLPAAGVNAPHERYRIWFVAYSPTYDDRRKSRENDSKSKKEGVQERDKVWESTKSNQIFRNASNTSSYQLQRGELNRSFRAKGKVEEQSGQFSGSIPSKWENFPTQPPLRNGDDGFSCELDGITLSKWFTESIKAGGNAIVPQVALQIFKSIEQFNRL